jgi:ABC-type branched-subunit amino acid transport system ATPase component/branched-subunit amino acid ABC-type transport system permease component
MLFALSVTGPTIVRGLASGVVFALLAAGLVLVYRSSGIINFAHAELGLVASAMVELLVTRGNMPYWMTFPAALGTAATIAALCEIVVIRRLRNAPKVMTVVATLGLSQFLVFLVAAVRGEATSTMPLPPGFPEWHLDSLTMNPAFTAILILGPLSVVGVSLVLSRTRIGKTIRGAAANPDAARLAGLSPAKASAMAWGIAGALSGLSSILVTGAFGSAAAATAGPALLVPAIAAAVIARFRSLGIAFAAGLALGVFQEVVAFNVDSGGAVQLAMFVVVLVGLMLQRRTAPRQDDASSWMSIAPIRLPRRARQISTVLGTAAGAGLVVVGLLGSSATAVSLMFVVATASIALSVFVITGLSGQLSLGQFAVAGVGAVIGIRAATASGDILVGLFAAGVVGALTTMLIGLPGLRLKGLFAAVTTLSFAVVTREWLLAQTWMAGFGRALDEVHLLGLELRTSQARFGYCVAVYLVLALAVHNVNRSGLGRRMRALRDNENQARGFTVGALNTRASSFAFAGFVAGASGLLLGVAASNITAANFPSSQSITIVAAAVLGGLQGVFGSLLGALYLVGIPRFLPLDNAGLAATSFGWLALLLAAPQGIGGLLNRVAASFSRSTGDGPAPITRPAAFSLGRFAHQREPFNGIVLEARGLQKFYGGVRAVDGVNLELRQGETLGLIGGNGAGKTTVFELLGGFVKADAGSILFRGRDISALNAEQRARLGIIRSFQDAGLFSTFTVREALLVALERRHRTRVLPALLGLGRHERRQRALADELLAMCGLSGYADSVVATLSTGTRRIAEIACMIALDPDVLLLDEPSAGIAQRETEALVGVIRSVREQLGTTIVVIEHDMPFIRALSNRIVVMETGSVLAVGDPDTVLADERVIASYLGTNTAAIDRSGETRTDVPTAVIPAVAPGRRRRWVVPTRDVRTANRIRRVTHANRQFAWVTFVWLILATASGWAEPRFGIPRWVAWTANNLFTFNFILHGAMSAYVYRMPRPRSSPRIMQVYLGYSIALFTLVSQSVIGTEPLHSITFAALWLLIGGHVALAIRSRTRRTDVPAAAPIAQGASASAARTTPPRPVAARRDAPVADGLSLHFPPAALAAVATVATLLGFVVTTRSLDLRKGGGALMPAVFAGIIGIHIVLGAQWFRLRKPSGLRYAPIALVVLAGLIYDNTILGLGSILGRGDLLKALSVPRYWIHAIGTPLLLLLVLEVGAKCGLSWAGRRRAAWTVFAFVLIGFGLGHDGFGQKLRFTTDGGTARYANEALTGPPISAIAVIIVVLAVAIMIWHRGASSMMAVTALIMLVGAAIGASVPLLGNLAECFFVISLLAGMQAAAGRRAVRSVMRRDHHRVHTIEIGNLSMPWTTISLGLLVAVLGVVHASANVEVAHGSAATVIAFCAVAVITISAAYVLYTAVLPGSKAASLAALSLVLFAVDALMLMPGNVVGETTMLDRLHATRLVLVPLAAALLFPFIGSVAAAAYGAQQRVRHGQRAGWIAAVAGVAVSLAATTRWRSSGFALRSAPDGFATPGLLALGAASVAMVAVGRQLLRRTSSASPFVLAVLAVVATWGGQFNPLVLATAPVALAGSLVMAWTAALDLDRRAQNQRGLRRVARRRSSVIGAAP